ncbi:MAG: hypothetical protein AAF335_04495, partial [Bacteroidota bacterium]
MKKLLFIYLVATSPLATIHGANVQKKNTLISTKRMCMLIRGLVHQVGKKALPKELVTIIRRFVTDYPYFKLDQTVPIDYTRVHRLVVHKGIPYAIGGNGKRQIARVDIKDEKEPIQIQYFSCAGHGHHITSLFFWEKYTICATSFGNLHICEIDHEAKQCKRITSANLCSYSIERIVLHEEKKILFTANLMPKYQLSAIDISNIRRPKSITNLTENDLGVSCLAVYKDFLFVSHPSDHKIGVWKINYGNTQKKESQDNFDYMGYFSVMALNKKNCLNKLAIYQSEKKKDFLIYGDDRGSISIHYISKLVNNIEEVKWIRSFRDPKEEVHALVVQKNYLFTTDGDRTITVRDLTDIEGQEPPILASIKRNASDKEGDIADLAL